MAKRNRYHTDYSKLYPGETLTPEVIEFLKKSDRKIRYMEEDLKQGVFVQDQEKQIARFIPGRETSLERLMEERYIQFLDGAPSPEEAVIHADEIQRLKQAVKQLRPEEQALISALFYRRQSERSYGSEIGVSQRCVSYRKILIQKKLRKLLES